VTGFSKVTRDLTLQKEANDFILRQNKQLEEYAYIASHDLQEPLRKILTFSNMLSNKITDNDSAMEILGKINHSAERMGILIRSVLNYSQTKDDEDLFEEVDINHVVKEIETDFELLLQEKNGTIVYNNLPVINAIPIQMHQLFANLISNALKFNNAKPKITIAAEQESVNNSSFIKFTVTDNGIGFDPKFDDRIFRMFHRLHNDTKGTGIGLALCKKIAENHNGSIEVTSKPGAGTTFTIRLLKNHERQS
jgi:signal transduction histidine kinase